LKPAADTLQACRRWLEEAVIGLGFCPFAAAPYLEGRVRWRLEPAAELKEVLLALWEEAQHLQHTPPSIAETTLLVLPHAPISFEGFWAWVQVAEALLAEAGLEGALQLASFHPQYRFANSEAGDLGNYTNRSPAPILHLLREESVSRAVAGHPDPHGIPARNVARLNQMGRRAVQELWQMFQQA